MEDLQDEKLHRRDYFDPATGRLTECWAKLGYGKPACSDLNCLYCQRIREEQDHNRTMAILRKANIIEIDGEFYEMVGEELKKVENNS